MNETVIKTILPLYDTQINPIICKTLGDEFQPLFDLADANAVLFTVYQQKVYSFNDPASGSVKRCVPQEAVV